MFCYCVIPSQITISACVCWDVFCFCSHLSPQFISFPRLYADVCIPIEVLESPVGKAHLSILAVEGARVLGPAKTVNRGIFTEHDIVWRYVMGYWWDIFITIWMYYT